MGKELQFDGWQVLERLVIRALFGAFPPDVGPGPSVQVLVRSFLASCGLSRSAPKPEVWGSHRRCNFYRCPGERWDVGRSQDAVYFWGEPNVSTKKYVYKFVDTKKCRHIFFSFVGCSVALRPCVPES